MIANTTIEKVKSVVNITDIVGDFVSLKRSGSNLTGLCPFHREKSPSFNVNPGGNFYKCFGCGEGGDAIKFLQELQSLTFAEAVLYIAKKYGIQVEYAEQSQEEKDANAEKAELRTLYANVTHSMKQSLLQFSTNTWYLKRNITKEDSQKWDLFFMLPNIWEIGNQKYSNEALHRAGILAKKSRSYYNLFDNRVIFPIHDGTGNIIAYAGRALGDKKPKYINSPNTAIYDKSKVLYGYHHARKAIRKQDRAVIVEGYIDVIAMHRAGIGETVATCGTALTEEHIQILRRSTKNLLFVFDPDAAGAKATLRGIERAVAAGMNCKVCTLPHGKDPDEIIVAAERKLDSPEIYIKQLFENALGWVQYLQYQNRPYEEVLKLIHSMPDNLDKWFEIERSAALFKKEVRSLTAEMRNADETKATAENKLKELIESVYKVKKENWQRIETVEDEKLLTKYLKVDTKINELLLSRFDDAAT